MGYVDISKNTLKVLIFRILEPIGSMYGIFTYIYHKNQPNVGKYTIHGSIPYMDPMGNVFWGDFFRYTCGFK